MTLSGRHVLLIVTGGVAAYKALELIRLIQKAGGTVQPILTKAGAEFVTPLSLSSLAGRETLSDLFDLTLESKIGHIELSRSADLIVVAPATADFMAKMAQGRADDLASTTILARDTDVLAAPAMNVRMWQSAANQRNLEVLRSDGIRFVGPDDGDMACGEFGPGRMAEPAAILAAMEDYFSLTGSPLAGRRIVVTSGPTREWIDPVRYISNASSGKQGTAIAEALAALGASVQFVTGPAEVKSPKGCKIIKVTSAREMHQEVMAALPADVFVGCAAVADWRLNETTGSKIKKKDGEDPPVLRLTQNPDILAEVSSLERPQRPEIVVGFAAETSDLVENAEAKLRAKGCNWLLANDVSPKSGTFGGDTNHILFFTMDGHGDWGRLSKHEVGRKLAQKLAAHFASPDDPSHL